MCAWISFFLIYNYFGFQLYPIHVSYRQNSTASAFKDMLMSCAGTSNKGYLNQLVRKKLSLKCGSTTELVS